MNDTLVRREELIPTRVSLLSRLKDWGDQRSWQEFFETYWKLIYRTARGAGLSDAEAQEVVQETVIAVSKQMPKFSYRAEHGSFKSWLLRLTRWRITDGFRRRHRDLDRASVPLDLEDIPEDLERQFLSESAGTELEQRWNQEWEANLMDVAIERVKKKVDLRQFQLFDLYVLQEWPVQRIVKTLHVSRGRVYLAKHRVTGLIKGELRSLKADPLHAS